MLLFHKSKPKPIYWLCWQRIGDVGGGYGFAGVREIFALVDRVYAELEVGRDSSIFIFNKHNTRVVSRIPSAHGRFLFISIDLDGPGIMSCNRNTALDSSLSSSSSSSSPPFNYGLRTLQG
ncbi:hypothetical protein CMV_021166 [Castanea mollissima]|uniref:Uncharacterized protein n=1 Tax=Castanea mollissima TaxID=60419 RepID=A0A8J4VLX7_9ROSI|nr:hypothetical protein CMV_021166 [Castanea mollissima]